VRINAQLIDATTGGHLWADRYDRDVTDIFAVQDEVTRRIVSALQVALTPREEALIADSPTTNMEAHDLTLRAREILASSITKETIERARGLLQRAIELDPSYSEPYAGLGIIGVIAFNNNWTDDPEATIGEADALASKAVALGPNNAYAHTVLSTTAGFRKDFARSRQAIERSLELNPNDADALLSRGAGEIFSGNFTSGIEHIERARRVDPSARIRPLHFLGLANLLLGNYETAVVFFKERILLDPATDLSRAMLVSALGHLGRIDEAKSAWAELMEVNPDYSFPIHRSRMPFLNPSDGAALAAGLAKAGLHN
jgi:adenylate cyclase